MMIEQAGGGMLPPSNARGKAWLYQNSNEIKKPIDKAWVKCRNCNEWGHKARQCTQPTRQQQQQQQQQQQSWKSTAQSSTSNWNGPQQQRQQGSSSGWSKKEKCGNCGDEDHHARDCPKVMTSGQPGNHPRG